MAQPRWKDTDFPPRLRILFSQSPGGKLYAKDFCFSQWRKKSMQEIESLVKFVGVHSDQYENSARFRYEKHDEMQCFQDLVEPDDIAQGKLGNCWFLASCGAVAEQHPEMIKSLFVKMPDDDDGRCVIQLYNHYQKTWENVEIDDQIPVFKKMYMGIPVDTPLFARPDGRETWVMLLEKAMAKFHGGYAFLKGGYARHAMGCLTGAEISGWVQVQSNWWKEYEIDYSPRNDNKPEVYPKQRFKLSSSAKGGGKDSKEILKMLLVFLYKDYPITCGFSSHKKGDGIITGHSYSLLEIFPKSSRDLYFIKQQSEKFPDLKKTQLLKLRNPYAFGEWTGDWSDSDPKWNKYGDLKRHLEVKPANDGTFWIDFTEWAKRVAKIDICHYEGPN